MNINNSKNYPDPDMLNIMDNVVSSSEFTGLMQALPFEEDEVEEYSDIYEIPDQGSLKTIKNELKRGMEKG